MCSHLMENDVKKELLRKLKANHSFWSYDVSKMKSISDDMLIEHVLLHLDLEDIDKLFQLYPFRQVKKVWIENIVAQGEMYYVLNKFLAWYYFRIKSPGPYVKAMATRQLNKRLSAYERISTANLQALR